MNIKNLLLLLLLVFSFSFIAFSANAGFWDPSITSGGNSLIKNQVGIGDNSANSVAKVFTNSPGSPRDIRVIIAYLIKVLLGFVGIIMLGLSLYAGYNWMTAAGDSEKVATAKKTLGRAVIGISIILISYGITAFIMDALVRASTNT